MLLAALRNLAFVIDFNPGIKGHYRPVEGLKDLAALLVKNAVCGFIRSLETITD